jgi:hypothetical protein
MNELNEQQLARIQGLRDMADFLESHPDIQLFGDQRGYVCYSEASELAKAVKGIGDCTKDVDDYFYNVKKKFGPIDIQFYMNRGGICRKVSKGVKTVMVKVPDPTYVAPEPAPAVPMIEVEQEVEEFEYVCPESLLALASGGEA